MFGNWFPLSTYKPLPQRTLSFPKIFEYSVYTEVIFFGQMFPCLSDLVNYWIFIHSIIPPLIPLECRSQAYYSLVYYISPIPYE